MDRLKFYLRNILFKIVPELSNVVDNNIVWNSVRNIKHNSVISPKAYIGEIFSLVDSKIGDYTSISANSKISFTEIGKFCSIGPNFISGWGIHPTDGISTSPLFYSKSHATGNTFSEINKIQERLPVVIGNDVWIGANCFILDGVKIGNGVIIAAGAVVTKDVENFSIVGGVPAKVIKYRFEKEDIEKLEILKWWDFDNENLKNVERYFFDINAFLKHYKKN
ncbi:CatB-related O-acetyltransferase [Kaistella sp. G5-32]|uniref:CatB-related O-acetyltransferase n=1 Tax=Kaistella gelatinilytica TaxID=2787636 RepID=A0ABS0FC74_9FLAO|nr:CatB-related O-acetyltransferase [Kaistella gelatinilytica]MBF8457267.1 CatB-related O-acetyltransferase [Kaistella gelatinilytica]